MTKYDVVGWENIDLSVKLILDAVKELGARYDYVYGLPRGGLVAAVMISHRLEIPIILTEDELKERKGAGENILVVDDISDTGNALQEYKEAGYDIATLYVREHTTKTQPRYKGISIEHDNWLMFPWESSKEAEEKSSL